uniref:Bile acid-CoA:amino acid N-acyltransferase n=1 Tax=Capra hircus TaxID=9925 RepID=A0A452FY05_CAPHI
VVQRTATQASALIDEPVHIQDTESLEDEKGNLFHSQANYRANEVGEQAPFLGGYYVGVYPMSLLWSLKPEKILIRLLKRDVMNSPLQIQLKLYNSDGMVTHVAITTPNRWCVAPGVTRILFIEGCLQGACFLPPVISQGYFPGIIDWFGGIGGLIEFQASLLASHSLGAMALAYYNYEDLPFREAVNFVLRHPKLGPGGPSLHMKGAEIGFSMAIHLKEVIATVLINEPSFTLDIPQIYHDQINQPLPFSPSLLSVSALGLHIFEETRAEASETSFLPIEKTQGHFLFIVGEEDKNVSRESLCSASTEHLKRRGRNNWTLLSYFGVGHLIQPPPSPKPNALPPGSLISTSPCTEEEIPFPTHSRHEHSWKEIQRFLRKHLIPVVTSHL